MQKLDIARSIALSLLHTPYRWGGNNPTEGYDCSGFVIEILQSVGILPWRGDWSSDSLFNLLKQSHPIVVTPREGCLIFFGTPARITHVEYVLNSSTMIGASGGDSSTMTAARALAQDARVRIKPIRIRQNQVAIVDVFFDGR